jgi:phospholipid/cholesterol/gamma-HCH transport system permease protein
MSENPGPLRAARDPAYAGRRMPDTDNRVSSAAVPAAVATPPTWTKLRRQDRTLFALGGDWIAQSGRIPDFPADGVTGGLPLAFDTSAVGNWDTGLIEFLWDAKRAATTAGVALDTASLPPSARKLLDLLPEKLAKPVAPPRWRFRPFWWLGGLILGVLTEIGVVSELLAASVKGAALSFVGRARIRAVDLLANIRDAGPEALLIIGTVNFLIGAILAFVGAVQLRRFAADIFVADLVGLAVVREMAAVMTAIIMAGRTGGAYAARIATMRGNEELDALEVVGIPVSDYIVLPSVLALAITMPLLYLYGALLGMLGGFVVAMGMLSVTTLGYYNQTLHAVTLTQFIFGFGKTFSFAVMIGLTSCRIGLLAGRSAADVGIAATRAVVVGIVGVIVMDALFAVIATVIGF